MALERENVMIAICIFTLTLLLGGLASPVRAWADSVVVQEVLYDGTGSDADDAFTELYGTPGMSLEGWTLRGVNGANGSVYRSISLGSAIIPLDGLLVLATSSATGDVLSARDLVANVDWQNGPDAIQLLDDEGVLIDALQYGNAGIYGAGEGDYAVDVAASWSVSRDRFGTDTDDNASDFTGLATPTPGAGPSWPSPSPVPEPATLALLGTGVAGLAVHRRRRRDARDE